MLHGKPNSPLHRPERRTGYGCDLTLTKFAEVCEFDHGSLIVVEHRQRTLNIELRFIMHSQVLCSRGTGNGVVRFVEHRDGTKTADAVDRRITRNRNEPRTQ